MKPIAILSAAVVLVVAAWLILGGSPAPAPRQTPSLPATVAGSAPPPAPLPEPVFGPGEAQAPPAEPPLSRPGEAPPASPGMIEKVRREVASAVDDRARLEVLRREASNNSKREDYGWGRQILEGSADLVREPRSAAEVQRLIAELRSLEDKERVRVAAGQREVERERIEGRILHMKDVLEDARREKRPPEQILSIETMIERLRKELASIR